MTEYTDVMLDVETTGISKDHCAIIQIAAVKFNVDTREISHNMFNACLSIPNNRYWNEDTRRWWATMPETLNGIYAQMRDPRTVMEELYWWTQDGQYRMWGKPSAFDFAFIESYFNEYGPAMPFHFARSRDLRSFIHGVCHPYEFDERSVPFVGEVHNAIFDTLHQIKLLYAAIDYSKEAKLCSSDMTILS